MFSFNAEIRKANVRTDVIRPWLLCFRSSSCRATISFDFGPDQTRACMERHSRVTTSPTNSPSNP